MTVSAVPFVAMTVMRGPVAGMTVNAVPFAAMTVVRGHVRRDDGECGAFRGDDG